MPILVNGIPEPRIVLIKNDVVVDDFVLSGFEGGNSAPQYLDFEPDILRQEFDPDFGGEIISLLRGFRMRAELYWPYIDGTELQKLARLLDRRRYDKALFYPYATDKPYYFEEVSIDSQSIQLAYHYLLAQRNFTLKLLSAKLVDYVPLEAPEFRTWGNITLRFADLTAQFSTYLKTVTQAITGTGSFIGATAGFFKDGGTETLGGSKTGAGSWQTDIITVALFTIPEEHQAGFTKWQVGGVDAGTDYSLTIAIMNNVTVTAVF